MADRRSVATSSNRLDSVRALSRLSACAYPLTASRAIAARVEPSEWPGIVLAAREHALAPLLYAALKRCDRLNELPNDAREELRNSYLRSSVAKWQAIGELVSLLNVFENEQIPVIVLKGCALGAMLYEDAALRPISDVDILVPHAAMPRVGALLVSRGFEVIFGPKDSFGGRYGNEQAFLRRGKRPVQLDVHWHLLVAPYQRNRTPIEWFWQRTVDIQLGGRSARGLAPEAQLLHLAAHFVYEHRSARLIWSYDLALLLQRYGERMNWDEVIGAGVAFGLTQSLRVALANVADWWGVFVPADISARLDAVRPPLAERLMFRLATARRPQLARVANALCTPDLAGKIGYLWHDLFPDAAEMRTLYHVRVSWLLPAYYVWRVGQCAYRAVRSAISAVEPRMEVPR